MTMRTSYLAVPLLGVLLAFAAPFEPAKPGIKKKKRGAAPAAQRVGGAWSDPAFLEEHMSVACEMARQATRADFVEPPPARVGRVAEVGRMLAKDMDKAFRTLGAKDNAAVQKMGERLAQQVLAAYDPEARTVLVLPENAVAAAAAVGEEDALAPEVLRLLLVRMATIAMDRQLFPAWKEALDAAGDIDAVASAGAVLEGHGQYVAERVADHWVAHEGFPPNAFGRLVALLTADVAAGDALANEAGFAIKEGHAFMKVAAKKPGGVAKALQKPPEKRSAIFDPQGFFAPRRLAGGALVDRVAAELEDVLPAGEGWARDEQDHDQAKAERFLEPVPRSHFAAIMAAFQTGKAWTAKHDGGANRVAFLLEFRNAGMAEAYVNTAKGALKQRGGTLGEGGAGRDGGLPGFTGRLDSKTDGEERTDRIQVTYEGKYVLGFVTDDADSTRERQDDALEAAAEVLGKAQKTRKKRR
jgi:hypothetical protein